MNQLIATLFQTKKVSMQAGCMLRSQTLFMLVNNTDKVGS